MTLIAAIWLAFVLPLVVAAVGRHRLWTKLGALLALACVLAMSWVATVGMLGVLSSHQSAANWPSPIALAAIFLSGYVMIAATAFLRKRA